MDIIISFKILMSVCKKNYFETITVVIVTNKIILVHLRQIEKQMEEIASRKITYFQILPLWGLFPLITFTCKYGT